MNYQWSCAIVCEWASERGRVREWCHHYIAFRGHVLLMHCLCCLYIVVYACCFNCRAIPHIMHIDEYMLCITSSEYPQCCTQQPPFLLQSDSCRSHCQAQGLATTGDMAVAVDWEGGCSWPVRTISGRRFLQTVLALRKQLVHGEVLPYEGTVAVYWNDWHRGCKVCWKEAPPSCVHVLHAGSTAQLKVGHQIHPESCNNVYTLRD